MEARLMPVATFRCEMCGRQSSVSLVRYTRRVGRADVCSPRPRHHRQRMVLIQVQYAVEAA